MEFFQRANTVRLRSHHDKYLLASSDEESVYQDRHGTNKKARWSVEFVEGYHTVIRLKSCYGKYLTAAEEQYLLGVTGRKVLQTAPKKLDSSVEWEPMRDGMLVRLKTRYGNFLRANGGIPPWRNSITHDIPHRHLDWVLWEVDVVDKRPDSPKKIPRSESSETDLSSSSFHLMSNESKHEVCFKKLIVFLVDLLVFYVFSSSIYIFTTFQICRISIVLYNWWGKFVRPENDNWYLFGTQKNNWYPFELFGTQLILHGRIYLTLKMTFQYDDYH